VVSAVGITNTQQGTEETLINRLHAPFGTELVRLFDCLQVHEKHSCNQINQIKQITATKSKRSISGQ